METVEYPEIRESAKRLCADFPGPYWQELDRDRFYPSAFVKALSDAGLLSVSIPISTNPILSHGAMHALCLPTSF